MKLVERTLETLIALSKEKDGMSVSELAKKLDMPNSSTHRILTCLKDSNFVIQSSESKKYRLGYKVLTLSSNISIENNFTHSAKPYMEELAKRIGQTVSLSVLEGESVVCLDYVESKDTSLFMVRTGFAMPAHATSAGKAIQAYMPIHQVQQVYLKTKVEALTDKTKVDFKDFLLELDEVRKNGYAVSDEELQVGIQGVACPIFDYNKKVVGSVAFTCLKTDNAITTENINLLKETAMKISVSIGNE